MIHVSREELSALLSAIDPLHQVSDTTDRQRTTSLIARIGPLQAQPSGTGPDPPPLLGVATRTHAFGRTQGSVDYTLVADTVEHMRACFDGVADAAPLPCAEAPQTAPALDASTANRIGRKIVTPKKCADVLPCMLGAVPRTGRELGARKTCVACACECASVGAR